MLVLSPDLYRTLSRFLRNNNIMTPKSTWIYNGVEHPEIESPFAYCTTDEETGKIMCIRRNERVSSDYFSLERCKGTLKPGKFLALFVDKDSSEFPRLAESFIREILSSIPQPQLVQETYDIAWMYENANRLCGSCMTNKPSSFLEIYRLAGAKGLYIEREGHVVARAILWTNATIEGWDGLACALDNCYGDYRDIRSLHKYAEQQGYADLGYINMPDGSTNDDLQLRVHVEDPHSLEHVPYMDNMVLLDMDHGILTNDETLTKGSCALLTTTNGCDESEEYFHPCYATCAECEDLMDPEDTYNVDGLTLCGGCEENITDCEDCGCATINNRSYHFRESCFFEDTVFCEACYGHNVFYCNSCEEEHLGSPETHHGEDMCSECYEEALKEEEEEQKRLEEEERLQEEPEYAEGTA